VRTEKEQLIGPSVPDNWPPECSILDWDVTDMSFSRTFRVNKDYGRQTGGTLSGDPANQSPPGTGIRKTE